MEAAKKAIFNQLQQDILRMHGLKQTPDPQRNDLGLGPILSAFPGNCFPLAAIHEMICPALEDSAATSGFLSSVLAGLMQPGGAVLWISAARKIFPPALVHHSIEPERVIFIDIRKEIDILWAMEEALKCEGLAAVIGEVRELSFTASRRLQLAVEQSHVTGFVIRHKPRNLHANACNARWRISSLPSMSEDRLPGIGFPKWKVIIEKVRNGKPGQWELAWASGRFVHEHKKIMHLPLDQKKKTG